MTDILVHDLEEPVVERLKIMARERRTTLESVVASILRDAVASPPRVNLLERADAIAAMTPAGVRQTDSTVLVREDRDL